MELCSSPHSNSKNILKKRRCEDSDCNAIVFQMTEGAEMSNFPSYATRGEKLTKEQHKIILGQEN